MVGGSLLLEPQIIGRICGSAERMLARALNWEGMPGCRSIIPNTLHRGRRYDINSSPRVLEQFTWLDAS